jgi:hypothetical protein
MGTHSKELALCFMPTLLPDELLYSLLGRLAAINVLGPSKRRMYQLFGSKNVIPSRDLPTQLQLLHYRLGPNSPWESAAELIETGTIYPYHRPFFMPERHRSIEKIMLFGGGKGLKSLMGRLANRFGANPRLRHCSLCVQSDIATYGAPYWHRAHQLPGIISCYKHQINLVPHDELLAGSDKQRLILAPCHDVPSVVQQSDAPQVAFANLSRDLLEARMPAQVVHVNYLGRSASIILAGEARRL